MLAKNKVYKNFIELLKARKSIREYSNRAISEETLSDCIEAARLSPSACNIQPWEFRIVNDRKLKHRLTEGAFKGIYYPNQFAKKAPIIIVVLAKPDKTIDRMARYIHDKKYYLLDIGIACSNLILRAYELGIGSCILGWFDKKKVGEVLRISRDRKIIALISLGYFKKEKLCKKNRKNLREIVKFNLYE